MTAGVVMWAMGAARVMRPFVLIVMALVIGVMSPVGFTVMSGGQAAAQVHGPTDAYRYAASWGWNGAGQLGNADTVDSKVPVDVVRSGALQGRQVTQVSAGGRHSCAVTDDGAVACWGSNADGQLGDGTTTDSSVPVLVDTTGVLADTRVVGIALGGFHTCAVTEGGTVACWGDGSKGQLGNGSTTSSSVPVAVNFADLLGDQGIAQVIAGGYHACAVSTAGNAYCWGSNLSGQLGDNTTQNRNSPVAVVTGGALSGKTISTMGLGVFHTCAVTSDGGGYCWGDGAFGGLGNGDNLQKKVPTAVSVEGVLAGTTWVDIGAGLFFSCAVDDTGAVYCWGVDIWGQLGDGDLSGLYSPLPVAVDMPAGRVATELAVGGEHVCVVADNAASYCWGNNNYGQLGDGETTAARTSPWPVVAQQGAFGTIRPVLGITAGTSHTVAIYAAETAPSAFNPVAPTRVLDTRKLAAGEPLEPGSAVAVDLSEVVPAGTVAVAFTVTITGQTASGFVEVGPAGVQSGSSTVNWTAPLQTIANSHVAGLSDAGVLEVSLTSAGTAHIVVDITGAFVTDQLATGALFNAVERRVYDSRDVDGPLTAGESRALNINNDVRAAAAGINGMTYGTPVAAAVNVTITGTTGSGVVAVAAGSTTDTSAVNWSASNQTIANALITAVEPDGTFTVTNGGNTAAHVVVDVTGVFAPGGGGALFYPTDPSRTYDSRIADPPLTDTRPRLTTQPVPPDAVAVALNTTITGTTGSGLLALTAPTTPYPATSTVNWFTSPTTRANGSIVGVTDSQTKATLGGLHTSHYLHDLNGYFE